MSWSLHVVAIQHSAECPQTHRAPLPSQPRGTAAAPTPGCESSGSWRRPRHLAALRAAPDSSIAPFNDGNALYRTGEFQRAIEAYQQAAERDDPVLDGQAWYNLGNALYRQQQLKPAVEAYKQALRKNPTDADAKHNLELTLEQLQQQDQQDQQALQALQVLLDLQEQPEPLEPL